MFDLPLHPALVHIPVGLAVIMPLLAGGLAVAILRGWLPARAWVVAVGLQAVLLVGAFGSLASGEADEDRAERTVGEAALEAHETAAKIFTGAAAATLLAGIGALALSRKPAAAGALRAGFVAGTLAVVALGGWVGHLGGKMVYGNPGIAATSGAGGTAPQVDDD
ncbi:MAG: hypothetical protein IT463_15110 [Planctomycetes bacterium]|nr:hypothetical protein [Planctomycetota bacterium]